ncbi:AP-4 complex subunit epsilon-1 isoform X2 [Anabrus simplex]|uniref:AP-4 complex subunit epsilon-1 isoform X2 n=1 Tax=Anabrus simplex TaxID=316456 RepID=UPI0035A367F1
MCFRSNQGKMLGYKADFAHIHAVKLAQCESLIDKRKGYLASVFFLQEQHPLSVLLVNTIVRDLSSRNIMILAMALTATCYLIPSNQAPTVLPLIADRLNHQNEFVRSKAVIALHHFLKVCPDQCYHYIVNVKALLSDKDPGVVAVVLQFLVDAVQINQTTPVLVAELAPALVQIQQQILEGKLPHEYTYRGLHAPWMQISVLRLIQQIKVPNPNLEAVIQKTLVAAKRSHEEAIGAALVSESITTLVQFKQSEDMLALAMTHISSFLESKSQNLRYAGLSLLEVILYRYHLTLTPEQQQVVLSSLQHPDHAVKRKTLSLLCVVANEKNVQAICSQVVDYAQDSCEDNPHLRSDLVDRAVTLTDKFPDINNCWHIAMLIRILPLSTQDQTKSVQRRIKMCLLSGKNHDLTAARHKVIKILKKYSESKTAATSILEVYVWAVSQFELLVVDNAVHKVTPDVVLQEIIDLGEKILKFQNPESGLHYGIKEFLLSSLNAITHVIENHGTFPDTLIPFLNKLKKFSIGDSFLRASCSELLYMLPQSQLVCEYLKPLNGGRVDDMDFTLSFLDEFVCESLRRGEQPFQPKMPKAATIESALASLGTECLSFPTSPSVPYQSPVCSEKNSIIGSSSSEDFKSNKSLKLGLPSAQPIWTKEGRVKVNEQRKLEETASSSVVCSPDPSMFNPFEPHQNTEMVAQDPLEDLLNKDFQKLSVIVKENR